MSFSAASRSERSRRSCSRIATSSLRRTSCASCADSEGAVRLGSSVPRSAVPVWLGHGASGGPETMQPYIKRLTALGIDAAALRLPLGSAERAARSLRDQVGTGLPTAVIGGHSYGGRVASMVAAETPPAGLGLLS